MKRRDVVSALTMGSLIFTANKTFAQFGGLKSLTDKEKGTSSSDSQSSSGSVSSWKEAAELFSDAKNEFAKSVSKLANISADIADALDLKSEAETLRGEAKNLSSKGDAMGSSDLDTISENSSATNALIDEKLKAAEALSDDQKASLGKAAVDYVPLMISTIGVAMKVKDTVSGVTSLGSPGFSDGRAAISAAREIPSLGPNMIRFTADSTKTGVSLINLMNTKGVSTPDTSDLDSQLGDLMS
jgi:hypothetical protein